MKFIYLTLLFLLFCLTLSAQLTPYEATDKKALAIPIEKTSSLEILSRHINQNFSTSEERLRAIYTWITHHINYDITKANEQQSETDATVVALQVLKEKKGVCYHYANLFKALADKAGVPTYCVSGYTKKDGKLMRDSHEWCLSQLGSEWYFFDATWGAGYLDNGKYVRCPNSTYYKVCPSKMSLSHMPFDPMWQFTDYPLRYPEFDNPQKHRLDSTYFNYSDTLKTFLQKQPLSQWVDTRNRMLHNGDYTALVKDELLRLSQNINVLCTNDMIAVYNNALRRFNDGVNALNLFIQYRNQQFKPVKEENEVRQMVLLCAKCFSDSEAQIGSVLSSDKELFSAVCDLKQKIQAADAAVKEQQEFVDKYYSTKKILRKSLFYKYTWMGVPLN